LPNLNLVNNFQTAGFQTLQNLQNINPLDLNKNQNFLRQDWIYKIPEFTSQNRANPSSIQYNVPSFPSLQSYSYQGSFNPFYQSSQNWMDPRSMYNGAINLPSY
jgi:hypothetical protein